MSRWYAGVASVILLVGAVVGCADMVMGTPTWPGDRLERTLLTAADFPPGVEYGRITDDADGSDGGPAPSAMLSTPPGCADGLTRVIENSAERGPGSAAQYLVTYDGARIVMTVLTSALDLDALSATAQRCARFETFFDMKDQGILMTTTPLSTARADALTYQQTMNLRGVETSVYFSFENVGDMAVFGIALPVPNPSIAAKGELPQTFLDMAAKQADRL